MMGLFDFPDRKVLAFTRHLVDRIGTHFELGMIFSKSSGGGQSSI